MNVWVFINHVTKPWLLKTHSHIVELVFGKHHFERHLSFMPFSQVNFLYFIMH